MITPRIFVVEITNECNLECKHCSVGAIKNTQYMPAEFFQNTVAKISLLGAHSVILTGGEPLLHPDLPLFIQTIISFNMRPILTTNGLLLDFHTIKNLKLAGLHYIQVSVDGLRKNHEYIRGRDTYAKTLQAIRMLSDQNFFVTTMTVLNKLNCQNLKSLIEELVLHGSLLCAFERMTSIGRAVNLETLQLSYEENLQAIQYLSKLKKLFPVAVNDPLTAIIEGGFEPKPSQYMPTGGCLAGVYNWAIDIKGNLKMCTRVNQAFGDFLSVHWSNLWQNRVLQSLLLRDYGKVCGQCSHKLECGGCRAEGEHCLSDDTMCPVVQKVKI